MELFIGLKELTDNYLWEAVTNIALAIVILVGGRLIANLTRNLTRRFLSKSGQDGVLVNFAATMVNILITLLATIAALDQLGVNTTSLIALLGAAGIAIGLALKDSLGNFAAGIMLIVSRPFDAGDYVEVSSSAGSVEKIGLFTTTLITPDNKEITVPNGSIYAGTIINWSARDTRRIDLSIGISYEDSIAKAKDVIHSLLDRENRILADQSKLVGVLELADNCVILTIRIWVRSEDYFATKLELTEQLKIAFDDAGITIPYPQMTIHSKSTN
ncbi:MAG: mechanosensitive ion channel protein MscS [Acidiferrobacteraceae bacterium]|nr:mechanosensitive ion channel protein MscS [Acidiferrobacteraceae bacterium]